MTIQQFIEKAIEGGWKPFEKDERVHKKVGVEESGWIVFTTEINVRRRNLAEILLDPLAWQAVWKVEGWKQVDVVMDDYTNNHPFMGGTIDYPYSEGAGMYYTAEGWVYNMHSMIDALAEGKTIEEYLATL